MARKTFTQISRKISCVVVFGILATFAGVGNAVAAPDEPTDTPLSASTDIASSNGSDDTTPAQESPTLTPAPTPTLTIPLASADADVPSQTTQPESTPEAPEGTDVAIQEETDSADGDQGIDAADDDITSPVDPGDLAPATGQPNADVDLNQIPYSGSSTQNPDMARNPSYIDAGTPVLHEFDVVVANIYPTNDQIPAAAPVQPIDPAAIAEILKEAAAWWSNQTQLNFTFNMFNDGNPNNMAADNLRIIPINTTCTDENRLALAAYGQPFNARPYTDTNKDLLILETRNACGNYSGIALTVAYPGNVFQGGIFRMWTAGWTGDSTGYDFNASVLAHEFGHTIGLLHSNIKDCAGLSIFGDDTIGFSWNGTYLSSATGCTLREYADTATIMSAASTLKGEVVLNSLQRWYLGVARDATNIVVRTGVSTTVILGRADLEQQPAGVFRGAVIPFTTDDYILGVGLEYRWPRGTNDPSAGVYLTLGLGDTGMESDILVPVVGTRGSVTDIQQPLNPGDVAVSADGRVKLQVMSQDDSIAVVQVTVGGQPGVAGDVSIQRNGRTLTALAASMQATNITYQWVKNGVAIPGATDSTYTPPTDADLNAVYRVEATMTASGLGPTTRYSRGIMVDAQPFTMVGDTARFLFLDKNGQPVQCDGGSMGISVYTGATTLVMAGEVTLTDSGTKGICQATLNVPLTGVFRVVATFPDHGPRAPIDWLSAFWSTAETQWAHLASGATASLFVGRGDYTDITVATTPTMVAGVDQAPLQMTVSVSDASGQPIAGVPVTFNVPTQLVATAVSSSTDEHGFAYATLQWNSSSTTQIPENSEILDVSATVGGISQVTGSPAPILLRGNGSSGRLEGVFENTTAVANTSDSVTLYIRAWDDGVLVEDQPNRIQARFSPIDNTGTKPTVSDPVWDEENLRYVVTITSSAPVEGGVVIVELTDGEEVTLELDPVVTFVPGDPAGFVGTASVGTYATPVSGCADGTRQVADVSASLVDEYGNWAFQDGAVVTFTLPVGSPLRFLTTDMVMTPDVRGQYHIDVASPLAGTFDVTATLHGTLSGGPFPPVTIPVTFGNNSVDTTASSVSVTSGTKLADGTQTQTVTANLISLCSAVMTNLAADGKQLGLTVSAADTSGIVTSDWVEDSAHPGTYTATIASTQPGTYTVGVNLTADANTVSNPSNTAVTTAVNSTPLSVEFVQVPPNAAPPIVQPSNGSLIYGTAEPGVTVRVRYYDANNIGRTVSGCGAILVGDDGTFSCPISPRLPDGTMANVSATGVNGVPSESVPVIIHAPYVTVSTSPVRVGSTEIVTGCNFNPNESVTYVIGDGLRTGGPATSGPDGTVTFPAFTVGDDFAPGTYVAVLTGETTGDVSKSFDVITVPVAPTLQPTNGTLITGTVTPGLTVKITVGEVEVPGCVSVPVAADGSFSCTPNPKLADNTTVAAVALDSLGTASAPTPVQVHAAYASVANQSVTTGGTQQFVGHNFNPGELVTAETQGTPYSLGPIAADSGGIVTFSQFTIASDAPIGTRTVILTGPTTGVVTTTFVVVAPSESASPTASVSPTASASPTESTSPTGSTSPTQTASSTQSATASPTGGTASPSTSPTSGTTSPSAPVTSPSSTTTSPSSTTTSPTSGTTSPSSPVTSPTGSTSPSPTGSTGSPTASTSSATASPSSSTSPTSSTTSPSSPATSPTGSTSPTSTSTTSPTSSTSSPTSGTTGPTSSTSVTTSPTSSTSGPTSSTSVTTSPTSSTSGPTSSTSVTTSPTSSTSSTTSPSSSTASPTSSATSPSSSPTGSVTTPTGPATSATTLPSGPATSVSANPVAPTSTAVPPSTSVPTGGQANSKVPGLVFLALLVALGGFVLVRVCRTTR